MELPPNDLNNNPHLRNQDARFRRGGENPRLYIEVPPMNIRFQEGVTGIDLTVADVATTETSEIRPPWMRPEEATRLQRVMDRQFRQSWPGQHEWHDFHRYNIQQGMHRLTSMHHPTIDLTDPPNEAYAHTRAYDHARRNIERLQESFNYARRDGWGLQRQDRF